MSNYSILNDNDTTDMQKQFEEEAQYWFIVARAAELYAVFGDSFIENVKKYANKCGCEGTRMGSCC